MNEPQVIYLQVGEDYNPDDEFSELDTTWSVDSVYATDIEYCHVSADELARLRAVEAAAVHFMDEFLSGEYCPNCLNAPEYHDDDCRAGKLAAALAAERGGEG